MTIHPICLGISPLHFSPSFRSSAICLLTLVTLSSELPGLLPVTFRLHDLHATDAHFPLLPPQLEAGISHPLLLDQGEALNTPPPLYPFPIAAAAAAC